MNGPDTPATDRTDPESNVSGNENDTTLSDLLDDPDALEALGRAAREKEEREAADTSDAAPALSADLLKTLLKLPDLLGPLQKLVGTGSGPAARAGCGTDRARRNALLLALKPYLNRSRCETIDVLIQLGKLSDVLQGAQLPQVLQKLRGNAGER